MAASRSRTPIIVKPPSIITFFRFWPTRREFSVETSEQDGSVPLDTLREKLFVADIFLITGRFGEELNPTMDINFSSCRSDVYEVTGDPVDLDSEHEEDNTLLVPMAKDHYEKAIWEQVVVYLSTGEFPEAKWSKKAKENFKRRIYQSYSLGTPDESGPVLYFTSLGRRKITCKHPTLHPEIIS